VNKNICIHQVALDITYKCNFRCLHCFNSSGDHNLDFEELSDEEILSLCDDIIKFAPTVVCICGGEPLIRKDLVISVVEKITNNTNFKTQVNMVTNGYLMTEEIAKKLKKAGIGNVQVSLDGASSTTHDWLRNKSKAFEKAVNALKLLNKAGIETGASCVPTKMNYKEIDKIIQLCKELGVKSFRMQPLMLLGKAKKHLNQYILNDDEYRRVSDELTNLKYEYIDEDFSIEWGDPIQHLTDFMSESFVYNVILGINAYGYITASPYLPIYTGNLRKYSISKYIESDYNDYVKSRLIRELCNKVKTPENMDVSIMDSRIPENYVDSSIYLDWIDDNELFHKSLDEFLNNRLAHAKEGS